MADLMIETIDKERENAQGSEVLLDVLHLHRLEGM